MSSVWLLLTNRQGDRNQLIALAEAIGLPYEIKHLSYNPLRRCSLFRDERLLLHLSRRSRNSLAPPWPDLVIGLGYESIAVSRYVRRESGGRTRVVHLGNPRTRLDDLDLVITTPQYRLGERANVLALDFPIGNPAQTAVANDQEEQWLRGHAPPRRVIALGGTTRQWKIEIDELGKSIDHLRRQCRKDGGSLIVVTSPRTPPKMSRLLHAELTGVGESLVHNFPRFSVLLARGDEFFVTADSVSMLAEAILTGQPVGMIPLAPSARARLGQLAARTGLRFKSHANLALFWDFLQSNGLVGTVEHPVASNVNDTVAPAVTAVRQVLGLAPQTVSFDLSRSDPPGPQPGPGNLRQPRSAA